MNEAESEGNIKFASVIRSGFLGICWLILGCAADTLPTAPASTETPLSASLTPGQVREWFLVPAILLLELEAWRCRETEVGSSDKRTQIPAPPPRLPSALTSPPLPICCLVLTAGSADFTSISRHGTADLRHCLPCSSDPARWGLIPKKKNPSCQSHCSTSLINLTNAELGYCSILFLLFWREFIWGLNFPAVFKLEVEACGGNRGYSSVLQGWPFTYPRYWGVLSNAASLGSSCPSWPPDP